MSCLCCMLMPLFLCVQVFWWIKGVNYITFNNYSVTY